MKRLDKINIINELIRLQVSCANNDKFIDEVSDIIYNITEENQELHLFFDQTMGSLDLLCGGGDTQQEIHENIPVEYIDELLIEVK